MWQDAISGHQRTIPRNTKRITKLNEPQYRYPLFCFLPLLISPCCATFHSPHINRRCCARLYLLPIALPPAIYIDKITRNVAIGGTRDSFSLSGVLLSVSVATWDRVASGKGRSRPGRQRPYGVKWGLNGGSLHSESGVW